MTDRIHSCKESPNGRHQYVQVGSGLDVRCVHCKRRPDLAREGFTYVNPDRAEPFWQDLGRP